MHRSRWVVSCVAALGLAAGAAEAQQFHVPRFYASSGVHPAGAPAADPFLTRMAWVDLKGFYTGVPLTPSEAASSIAANIRVGLTDGTMQAGKVVITLVNIGHDGPLSETPEYIDTPSRFFREEDRLNGIDDDSFGWVSHPNGFMTDRTYRHPFLINAMTEYQGVEPPMKQWMRQFCQKYRSIQTNPSDPNYDPTLPDPDGVFLDVEPFICLPGDTNSVRMLQVLATHPYWNNRDVPGFPLGTRLGGPNGLYATAAAAYGWPSDINDATSGIVADIDHADSHPRNRPFLIWWHQIVQRAVDAVLDNCIYSVAAEFWPNAKAGNFYDSRIDNAEDSTGWFMERVDNTAATLRYPSKVFRRGLMEPQPVGAPMYIENSGRWLNLPRRASASLDAPQLYRITEAQWKGYGGIGWPDANFGGHQQPNLYLPGHPVETIEQTMLRLHRHTVESAINSNTSDYADGGVGGHEDRMSPWLEMVGTTAYTGTLTKDGLRPLLAMLRAKNVRSATMWTTINPYQPAQQQAYADAWAATSSVAGEVYATRIAGYTALNGELLEGEGDDNDPSRLEFTLRVNGEDRVVGLRAGAGKPTELLVVFSGLQAYSHPAFTSTFDITVECTTDVQDTTGYVHLWDFDAQEWYEVNTEEGGKYYFYTPSSTFDQPFSYESRRTFRVTTGVGATHRRLVSQDGTMLVRLIHTANIDHSSRYDLVQVVPSGLMDLIGGIDDCCPAQPIMQSDKNYDSVVDNVDLSQFMVNFVSGTAAADVNMDGVVNNADLSWFLTHYVAGN